MAILTEDEIDDVLYCARTNDVDELKNLIPTLFPKYGSQPTWILSQAVDDITGNSALHYASANGHLGLSSRMAYSVPEANKTTRHGEVSAITLRLDGCRAQSLR
jgi:hypothetical protein